MKTKSLVAGLALVPLLLPAASSQIVGWNNLGMHCLDSDYSVFSVLPPYNTIEAQLIVGGKLVTNGSGFTVTYQAIADPDGSINSTSRGKGNFYTYVHSLYGVAAQPDSGLTPWPMPVTNNTPQTMLFEPTNLPAPGAAKLVNWWRAEGIPISPYDDTHRKNPYPLMRLIARNGGGTPIATNDIVLPVSDEMDCRTCHASDTVEAAKPAAGWVWSGNPERDFRLNILRLHDEHQFAQHAELYRSALAARGFNPQGLYAGVAADAKPVLCAACHASEALGLGSYSNIPPLTASVHRQHAAVMDPVLHVTLDNEVNRAACYRCHPGSTTKCLRGAMGGAVAADGSMEMQCQSCHGNLTAVGSSSRVGWFMEPNCQSCHTGTATSNNGKIRFTTCFETNGAVRVATNLTFATNPDTPAPGISLYRFSSGHGGLQCSACHGSTHAEFPSTHRNDNLRNQALQGHAGVTVECLSCHQTRPSTITGGPHGLHPLDNSWAQNHEDLFEGTPPPATRVQCQACHGTAYTGTVLSRAQNTRLLSTKYGTRNLWRGQLVGCYDCHDGPYSSNPSTHAPSLLSNVAVSLSSGTSAPVVLASSGGNLTFRIISQPAHGSVGISNNLATYFADPGYVGSDQFTFAAWNGWVDSNLATGSVAVAQGPISLTSIARVPPRYPAMWPTPFAVTPTPVNSAAPVTVDWDFGDGSPRSAELFPAHLYATPGSFNWTVISHCASAATTNSGTILIDPPLKPKALLPAGASQMTLTWPAGPANPVLESTPALGDGALWSPEPAEVNTINGTSLVTVPTFNQGQFFRLRQAW